MKIKTVIKRISEKLIKTNVSFLYKKFNIDTINNIVLDVIKNKMCTYPMIKLFPLNSNQIYEDVLNIEVNKCCILLQGPIDIKNDFTIETCKMYKKMYPYCCIIVSTWEDEDEKILKKFEDIGVLIIKNKKPKYTGIGNINLQTKNTIEGINLAKKLGYKFLLKTRTDQRLNKNNLIPYFNELIEMFKVNDSFKISQNKRIIALNSLVCGSMFIPFHISDFMFFGEIDDILKLYSYPEEQVSENNCERVEREKKLKQEVSIIDYHYSEAPELKYFLNYIKVNSCLSKDVDILTVKTYWEFVKNYMIFLSSEDVGLYWERKLNTYVDKLSNSFCLDDNNFKMYKYIFNFENWLLLYNDKIKYNDKFENYYKRTCMEVPQK